MYHAESPSSSCCRKLLFNFIAVASLPCLICLLHGPIYSAAEFVCCLTWGISWHSEFNLSSRIFLVLLCRKLKFVLLNAFVTASLFRRKTNC